MRVGLRGGERLGQPLEVVEHQAAIGRLLVVGRNVCFEQGGYLGAGHAGSTLSGSGRRSSSRPMCESAGKSRVHESAITIVATPPATTAVTVPTSAATTPDSNAPSSFDALTKTISTAFTRPRSSFGVTSATVVLRMLTLTMSTKPPTASATSESGSQ